MSNFIQKIEDLNKIKEKINSRFLHDENSIISKYKNKENYFFIEFEDVLSEYFIEGYFKFLKKKEVSSLFVYSNRCSEEYYNEYGYFPIIVFNEFDNLELYFEMTSNLPQENIADSISTSEYIIFYDNNTDLLIYADIELESSIISSLNKDLIKDFKSSFEEGYLLSLDKHIENLKDGVAEEELSIIKNKINLLLT